MSTTKGQLAQLKSVQEDMEETCQHALLERQIALKELEVLREKQTKRTKSFSFFGGAAEERTDSCLSPAPKNGKRPI